MNTQAFDSALYGVSRNLRQTLSFLPEEIKASAEEIRIRKNSPLSLTFKGETVFVNKNSTVSRQPEPEVYTVKPEETEECFRLLCGNSVYAHTEEIKNGFIIMKNGSRAGVCGLFNKDGFIREVTSLNIRIAHQIFGAADSIIKQYQGGGLLIAAPPGAGKTTVLRDFIRQVSNGALGKPLRICAVDSRGEISGGCDLGPLCDVIICADKSDGIEIALRTMNPHIIAFDEVGSTYELNSIKESFFSGVDIVTTAHIGSYGELFKRKVTAEILQNGIIKNVALLPEQKGGYIELKTAKELKNVAV